jgi:alpha-L-rhamnosidase
LVDNLRCDYAKDPLGIENTNPRLSWELHSKHIQVSQTAYRILVSEDSNSLNKGKGDVWDSKKVSSEASIQVAFGGKSLQPAKKYYWKVMVWDDDGNFWSKIATWQMGLLKKEDWKNAKWIGYDELPDSMKIVPFAHGRGKKEWGPRKDVLPLLRKKIIVQKKIRSATAFICGLGQFELYINGKKTGDHFLDPGWTQYSESALYVSFDITKQLVKGENAIGVMLGNGFFYIPGERYRKLTGGYGYPKMISRILINYTDGSSENILSDASWKTAPSPIIFSSIYGGEDYDATLEQAGWNTASFDDSKWKNVVLVNGAPQLISQTAEPIKQMEKFSVVKKTELTPSQFVYDLGQNFSGIPSITVSGNAYDTVRIVPAELLNDNGTANQKGSGGPSYFTYILKGNGVETWQPRFSYYGFRYLQVSCIGKGNKSPQIVNVEGLHMRNATESAGSFSCSNELFNQTYSLINWAIKSNMMSVFTDCPHREKLGWLEQTHLMGNSVQYNFDIATLNRKLIEDLKHAQTEEGLIPEIAPEFVHFEDPFRDSPEWGSAAIILPWYNYQWYGEKQTLANAYEMMKRYIAYLEKKSDSNILSQGLGDWYDIGPDRPGVSQLTPKGLTATAMFYYDLSIMKKIAELLGRNEDAAQFEKRASSVKASFNEKFFNNETKQYGMGSQTANAMALYMGLVEPVNKETVIENLVKEIRSRKNALTAGDIGYRYLLQALEDAGRSDVIFDMNSRSDVPGYGYQLAHGATALTESWQAYPSVSNNHFMLGHLMEWFYSGLAGIKQADTSAAYKKIIIAPEVVGDVTWVKASYHCPYGMIRSEWKKSENSFDIWVEIPVNASAWIYFPPLEESFGSFEANPVDVKDLGIIDMSQTKRIVEVASGSYHFQSRKK